MSPPILDEGSFDGFVTGNEMAVIGFIGQTGDDAARFAGLAGNIGGKHPAVAFAAVAAGSLELFEMFGLNGTATAIFRERVVLYCESGIPDAGLLSRLLDRIASLDIGKVHAELEQERATEAALATHRVCPAARRGKFN